MDVGGDEFISLEKKVDAFNATRREEEKGVTEVRKKKESPPETESARRVRMQFEEGRKKKDEGRKKRENTVEPDEEDKESDMLEEEDESTQAPGLPR